MTHLVLMLLQLLVSPLPAPDCQRFCLGVCHWSWTQHRCMDTRVVFIGTWDPIPLDYDPPTESAFPVWKLSYPQEYGAFSLEHPSAPEEPEEAAEVQPPPEPTRQQAIRRFILTPIPQEGP